MPLREEDCAVTYKVLILGDDSVGKSALLDCLMGRPFKEAMYPTIGVDFVRKIFEVDGALVQLVIWDTAGQERFRSITRLQYKGVQGLILVYDVTNEMTYETLKYWIHSIQDEISSPTGGYEPIPMVLCGNKADLAREKKVSTARGQKMADREMAFGFYETSAKTGENVFTLFQTLAFHMTDICHPKLMKSYHPHLIRPIREDGPALREPITLRQFKTKTTFKLGKEKSSSDRKTTNLRQRPLPETERVSRSKEDHPDDSVRSSCADYPPWESYADLSDGKAVPASLHQRRPVKEKKTKTKRKLKQNGDGSRSRHNSDIHEPTSSSSSSSSVLSRSMECVLCSRFLCVKTSTRKKNRAV